MKITFHLSAFPVLSETFVLNQITGFIDLGHEVRIVATRRGDTGVVHPDVEAYRLLQYLTLAGDSFEHMPPNKLARLVKAAGLFFGATAAERKVLMRALNVRRFGKDAATLNLFYRSLWAVRAPDVYAGVAHCHFGWMGERMARARATGAFGAPVVTTFHGHDLSRDLQGRSVASLYRQLLIDGDLLLPVSRYWQQFLTTELGARPERVEVHHMGIDTTAFAPRAERATGSGLQVLSVGRFVEKKGLRYAIEAVCRLLDQAPESHYRLIGGGPLEAELAAQIQASGHAGSIELLGTCDSQGVRCALAESDVFLLPSVTASDGDQEGVPVVLMEAMACGLPVVSTQHSGIPELVEDGVSGLLAPERDVSALAEALVALHTDRQRLRTFGTAARARVQAEFDIGRLNARLVERFATLPGATGLTGSDGRAA